MLKEHIKWKIDLGDFTYENKLFNMVFGLPASELFVK